MSHITTCIITDVTSSTSSPTSPPQHHHRRHLLNIITDVTSSASSCISVDTLQFKIKFKRRINSFQTNFSFLYLQKMSENRRFSDVFSEYRTERLARAWNGLMSYFLQTVYKNIMLTKKTFCLKTQHVLTDKNIYKKPAV